MSITSELQSLDQDVIIQLFRVFGYNPGAGDEFYFCAHTGVTFLSKVYTPRACSLSGFKVTSQGTEMQADLTVSDADRFLTQADQLFPHIVGGRVDVLYTRPDYLDGGPLGNLPQSDRVLSQVRLRIMSRVLVPGESATYRLENSISAEGRSLPNRKALRKCDPTVRYRGAECGYTGSRMFTVTGQPTLNANLDRCGKGLADCRLRNNQSRFGGVPSLRRQQD
ncbi:phage minor tail protein L [Leptothoe sp. ISB3NOV94-8A]